MRILLLLIFIFSVYSQQEYYDRKYDNYDIDHVVQNPRLLRKYMDCFLSKGPCTPIGKLFKAIIPEVVITACTKCSPSQKRFARRTFQAFQRHVPDGYVELRQKLDPRNKYYARFEDVISGA